MHGHLFGADDEEGNVDLGQRLVVIEVEVLPGGLLQLSVVVISAVQEKKAFN